MARLGRGRPLKPAVIRGSVAPGLLLSTLTDDFTSLDTGKWPDNTGTTSVTGGKARVAVQSTVSAFRSANIYTLVGAVALVRIDTWPAASTATTAYGELAIVSDSVPSTTFLSLKADVVTGLISATNSAAGADAGVTTAAFSTAAPLWLRIDARTPGTITLDYSTSGFTLAWTTLRTIAYTDAPWITTAAVRAELRGRRDAGTNDVVEFDDFNLPAIDPASPQPVRRPAPWYRLPGKARILKGFHPGEATPKPLVISPFSGRKPFPLPPGAQLFREVDTRAAPTYDVGAAIDGSLPIPISVRLANSNADVLLVDEVRDVSFRSVVPGGFASATVTLSRSLTVESPDLALYTRMYIYDTRSGDTLWEGRIEDPGRSARADGEMFDVTAVGPSAHARDEYFPYLPIDTSVNHYVKFGGSLKSGSVHSETDSVDRPGVRTQFAAGALAGEDTYVAARTLRVYGAGLSLGSVRATAVGGADATGTWSMDLYIYGPADAELAESNGLTLTPTSYYAEVGTDFTAGQTMPFFRLTRTGASATPGDDLAHVFWRDIVVRATMVDEEGTPLTDYSATYVTSSQIIQDLIGSHTSQYDGRDAYIEVTSEQHTHFAYPEGTTVWDVLSDIMTLEGAYYWAAWETVPTSGLWRFEFRPWPTSVRYEASIIDGWTSPGSATDLYNKVIVTYVDPVGNDQVITRTSEVEALTQEGLTRTALIDLGSEIGTEDAAILAGDNYLAEHQYPSKNGRLTIARAVLDYDRGMMVEPWHIRPGGLIRVRGVSANPGALTAEGRDGSTVFRIVAVNFRASDGSMELELDSDAYSTSQAIAKLQTARNRR